MKPPAPSYTMLLASLPHLPDFERTKRLPIGPERLAQRLRLLDPEDQARLHAVCELLAWRIHAHDASSAMQRWRAAIESWLATEGDADVRERVCAALSRRSLLAALRRRHAGLPAPGPHEHWGHGEWMSKVARSWNEAHFGLAFRLPWLVTARDLLERGAAIELDRLCARLDWDDAGRLRQRRPAGYAAVLAYRLRWKILHDRLRQNDTAARARLQALVQAACPAHPLAGACS